MYSNLLHYCITQHCSNQVVDNFFLCHCDIYLNNQDLAKFLAGNKAFMLFSNNCVLTGVQVTYLHYQHTGAVYRFQIS